jgi:hypothetical protein
MEYISENRELRRTTFLAEKRPSLAKIMKARRAPIAPCRKGEASGAPNYLCRLCRVPAGIQLQAVKDPDEEDNAAGTERHKKDQRE